MKNRSKHTAFLSLKDIFFFTGFFLSVIAPVTLNAQDTVLTEEKHLQSDEYFNLSLDDLMNAKIVTATKKEKQLSEAPSVISVISHETIEKLAVTTMVDVLQYVPSIEVSMGVNGHYRLALRGIRKDGNILVLVNGHHINDFYNGRSIYDFPVSFIERIEIIRGPGSALFGTNAVAGVINIITIKNKKSATFMVGTNQTYNGAINYNISKDSTSWDVSFGFLQSDGANKDPRSDTLQTTSWTHNSVPLGSLATNRHLQDIYFNTTLKRKKLDFGLFGIMREQGSWVGPLFELSPNSVFKNNQFISDLSYKLDIDKQASFTPKIYADVVMHDYFTQERPAGYSLGNKTCKDGLFTKEQYHSLNLGFDGQFDYKVNDITELIGGVVLENMSVLDYDIQRNYDINKNIYYGDSSGFNAYHGYKGFANHDNVPMDIEGKTRRILALYAQGEFSDDYFDITFGGRYDYYSDFGKALNPRLGIIFKLNKILNSSELTKGLYFKVLYGQAFRAPTFNELYNTTSVSNDGVIGNKNLSPELVKSTEFSLDYRRSEYNLHLISFINNSSDIIGIYDPNGTGGIGSYQNIGSISSSGFGFESSFRFSKKIGLNLNYTFFNSIFAWNSYLVDQIDLDFINQDTERKFLVNSPQTRVNVELDLTTRKFQVFTGLVYGAEAFNNKRSAIEDLSTVAIPPYLQFHYSVKYKFNKKVYVQVAGNYMGLKIPVVGSQYFDTTSGSLKYSDPDASTNIEVLGFNGMTQPGSTHRVSINYNF